MNIMVGPDAIACNQMAAAMRCVRHAAPPCGMWPLIRTVQRGNSSLVGLHTNSCAAPELSQTGQRPATPRKEAAAPVLSGARPQASFTGARTADWECGRGGNAPLGRGAAAALT